MRKEEAVASYFIAMGMGEDEDCMTNLRLNKLMYFAQAWSLAMLDKPLFEEQMQAWPLGPVVPSIYKKYKAYGKRSIEEPGRSFCLDIFSEDELQLLSTVMACYGKYSTHGLVDFTHVPGSPWDKAIRSTSKAISKDDIKTYFQAQPQLKLFGSGASADTVGYRNDAGMLVLPQDWKDEDVTAHA